MLLLDTHAYYWFNQNIRIDDLSVVFQGERDLVEEIADLIAEVMLSRKKVFQISGDMKPAELVKSRFLKLRYDHIEYVITCLKGNASEERGLKLMHFFRFIEMLCHEFSHLCSYDRMMALTDWADPQLNSNNYDYHLHDEFIARVRGTENMLRMFAPYMENDLIYSMYLTYVNDTKTGFTHRLNELREVIEKERKGLEKFWQYMDIGKTRKQDEIFRQWLIDRIDKGC